MSPTAEQYKAKKGDILIERGILSILDSFLDPRLLEGRHF